MDGLWQLVSPEPGRAVVAGRALVLHTLTLRDLGWLEWRALEKRPDPLRLSLEQLPGLDREAAIEFLQVVHKAVQASQGADPAEVDGYTEDAAGLGAMLHLCLRGESYGEAAERQWVASLSGPDRRELVAAIAKQQNGRPGSIQWPTAPGADNGEPRKPIPWADGFRYMALEFGWPPGVIEGLTLAQFVAWAGGMGGGRKSLSHGESAAFAARKSEERRQAAERIYNIWCADE